MKILDFCVSAQTITLDSPTDIAAGSTDYLFCRFNFDDDWDGRQKAYRFSYGSDSYSSQENSDGLVKVPFEVINTPYFSVAVGGYKGTEFVPTVSIQVRVLPNGYGSADASFESGDDPTKGLTSQILEAAEQCKAAVISAENTVQAFESAYKPDIESNTSARHSHENIDVLDSVTLQKTAAWDAKQDALSDSQIQYISAIPSKADKTEVYTKTESDILLSGKVDKVSGKELSSNDFTDSAKSKVDNLPLDTNAALYTKADKSETYTDSEVDSRLDTKADKSSVYTKTESDNKLFDKADKSDVYTKTEINIALTAKVDKETGKGLSENDFTAADKAKVDKLPAHTLAELSRKANKADVYTKTETDEMMLNYFSIEETLAELDTKANKATTLEGYGITNAYTKTEVDEKDSALKDDISDLKQKSIPHTTASGYPLTVTDHLEGESVINYQVYGNSVQDGTPTPETPIEIQSVGDLVTNTSSEYYGKYDVPVTVMGKNLIQYPYNYTTRKINGITFTDNGDGSVTINGTATANAIWFFYLNKTNLIDGLNSGDTVTLSIKAGKSFSGNLRVLCNYFDTSGAEKDGNMTITSSTASKTKTITDEWQGMEIYVVVLSGQTVDNVTISPLLEKGSSATEYEPYKGKTTKHIYLDEPLRKVGNYADYIDFENQRAVRQIEVLDDTGTKTIDESLGIRATPTEEPITVPKLTSPNSAVMNVSSGTAIQPSQIDLTYYQDINKIHEDISNTQAELGTKANSADVYTKTEVDQKDSALKDDLNYLSTVNKITNVSINIGVVVGGISATGGMITNTIRARSNNLPVNMACPTIRFSKGTKHRFIYYTSNTIEEDNFISMSDWSTEEVENISYPTTFDTATFVILLGYVDDREITSSNLPTASIIYRYDYSANEIPYVNGYYYTSTAPVIGQRDDFNISALLPVQSGKSYRATKFRNTIIFDINGYPVRFLNTANIVDNTILINDGEAYLSFCWKTTDCEIMYFSEADSFIEGRTIDDLRLYHLFGKHLSLLGDSISSYVGTIPSGNDVYYTGSNSGVSDSTQMWWNILCRKTGMIPLVINGWSGSAITTLTDSSHANKVPMSDSSRTQALHSGETYPDLIIIAGGVNDYSYANSQQNNPTGWDGKTAPQKGNSFGETYACMIKDIQTAYPNAIIICLSTWFTMRGTDNGYTLINGTGYTQADYDKEIENVARIMRVPFINVEQCGFNRINFYPTYAEDSSTIPTHPNANGHRVMGEYLANIIPQLVKAFVN